MRLNLLSFLVFAVALSASVPARADRNDQYPQISEIDRLTALEFEISELEVDNFNGWFDKSRTMSVTIEYCHDLDTGDGRGTCWLLAQSKEWTVTAPPDSSSDRFSMARATYHPISRKDSRIKLDIATLKKWMESLNPGADLPEYLAVNLVSRGYIVKTPGTRIRIPIIRGCLDFRREDGFHEEGFHSLLSPQISERSGIDSAAVWMYATYVDSKRP